MRKWLTAALVVVLVFALAVPAMGAPVKGFRKPTFISHPYVKYSKVKAGRNFTTWGYVNPRLASGQEATVTIFVQSYKGHGSWETSSGLETTAALSATGRFKRKTNYSATMNIGAVGRYRMRAKLVWKDSNGNVKTKWSSLKYIWIRAAK